MERFWNIWWTFSSGRDVSVKTSLVYLQYDAIEVWEPVNGQVDVHFFFSVIFFFGFIASFIYRKSEESGWREGSAGFESALRTNAECVTDMLLDCYDLIHRTLCNHDMVT